MGEQVKLLMSYDIRAGQETAYRRFIMEEFLPQAQELGLIPTDAWHTSFGSYPLRLLGFVANDLDAARTARETKQWQDLIHRLEGYTIHLKQKIVPFRGGFQ